MKIKFLLIASGISLSTLCHTTPLPELLKNRGFKELPNRLMLKQDYRELYKSFDDFIELIENNPEFAQKVHDLESRFLGNKTQKARYCSAPPSYRDPRHHSTKRFDKIYFQFIREHYDLVKEEFRGIAGAHKFIESMRYLDESSKIMFKKMLPKVEAHYPGFTEKVMGKHSELTVISKIVRYRRGDTPHWGTTPHVDKSALSLILDSDDHDDDSLWLCEDTSNPTMEGIKKPARIHSHKDDRSSALVIPGAACVKAGIDLKPTVHGVAPITTPFRHAVISFLLIPDMDMSDIVTDFKG